MLFVLLRRVIVLVILLAVLAGVAIAVGATVGRPIVEDRAAERLSEELGAPVEVRTTGSARDLARGNVGDVEATAPRATRGGLEIEDIRVIAKDASLDLGALRDREVHVITDGIEVRGAVTEEALDAYVRPIIRRSGFKAVRDVRIVIEGGQLYARGKKDQVPIDIVVDDAGSLRFETPNRSPLAQAVGQALAAPVKIGDLPFGIRIDDVRVSGDRLVVEGSAPAGEIAIV